MKQQDPDQERRHADDNGNKLEQNKNKSWRLLSIECMCITFIPSQQSYEASTISNTILQMRKRKLKRLYDLTRTSYEVTEFEFKHRQSNTIQLCVKLMEVAIIDKNTDANTRYIKCDPTSICIKKSLDNEVPDSDGKP